MGTPCFRTSPSGRHYVRTTYASQASPNTLAIHRPHRIRLLKEIERRKRGRDSATTGVGGKRVATVTGTWVTNDITTNSPVHEDCSPPENLEVPERLAPLAPAHSKKPETAATHATEDKKQPSGLVSEIDQNEEVADSSSTSTACTPYEQVASPHVELAPLAPDCTTTPREGGDSLHPSSAESDSGEVEGPLSIGAKASQPSEANGVDSSAHLPREEYPLSGRETASSKHENHREGLAPLVQKSEASVGRLVTTPTLKGTLEMSGVRAASTTIALVGNEPFLQVKTCDQLRRTNVVAGKGD